ncbi:MAG: hypothetical protein HYW24_00405 [Candidatus Aenigmarchaeota archaeon]|nr:hypothetical protein [Candidatus Aenigmarchaeota archaeon]
MQRNEHILVAYISRNEKGYSGRIEDSGKNIYFTGPAESLISNLRGRRRDRHNVFVISSRRYGPEPTGDEINAIIEKIRR